MPLKGLDHYFVYCQDLDESKRFYADVLGFEEGERPAFSFPGAWMYLHGHPVIHMGDAAARADLSAYFGARAQREIQANTGPVDHIAFEADDFTAFRQRLEDLGIDYRHNSIAEMRIEQLFVQDPNGIVLELNFRE